LDKVGFRSELAILGFGIVFVIMNYPLISEIDYRGKENEQDQESDYDCGESESDSQIVFQITIRKSLGYGHRV